MGKYRRVPKILERILKIFILPQDRESLPGDFEEIYARISSEKNPACALFWHVFQIIKLIPACISNNIYWSTIMFKNYLKIAFRNIKKHKSYSFINIFGLAVGIAASSLILLWVQDETSYDSYHEKIDNIYLTALNVEGNWWNSSNWALSPILKNDYPEVEKASRAAYRTNLLKYKEKSFNEPGVFVDEDFFDIFTYEFLWGDPNTALSVTNSIILTEETAVKYFPSENPMGKVITSNNNTELTVTGVIKNVPSNSTFRFNYLMPVKLLGERKLNSWAVESRAFLLLKEGTDVKNLISKISGIVMKHDTRTKQKISVFLQPYKKLHLYSLDGGGQILYVYIFSAAAFLILMIACINFMNLATARVRGRAKEIGMRKVLGAVKKNIIRQFYSESIFLAVLALIIAILLIMLFLPAFNTLAGKQLALDLTGSPAHVIGLLGITLFTGLISGSYPALVLSAFRPINILKTSINSKSGKSLFRKVLVISQFTAAIILIISTVMIYKQLHFIRNKNLGFNREQVLVVPVNTALKQNYDAFKNQISNYPGIMHVTAATNLPTGVGNINPVYWEGKTADHYKTINWTAVDYDYFDTFEMEFAEGRKFSREYSTDKQNYIVNEAAVEMMGFESAVGRMFSLWSNEGKIIGVVKNFHAKSLHNVITPIVFTMDPNWDWSLRNIFVKIKPDNIDETIDHIKTAALKAAPDYPFDYSFLDEHFDRQYQLDRQIGTIFQYFSFIAVFISCMGLFGLAAFMVQQRTKEISIRRILGASKSYIMMLLSKEFLLLILAANLIAWPAAYLIIGKLMENYAYRTDITIWIFLTAGLLALILTFITISFQTYKAARTNPVETLRYE